MPISDLINCNAFHSTGMNPNFIPWRTRPSNLTSVPLALPPMLHPDLPYRPQTVCRHMPISGSPTLLCILSGPFFPTSSCSCLSSSVDFSEACANYPNRSAPTPMPILTPINLFSIYFLQITYHHLKNIICYKNIVCLSNLTPSLECGLPEGTD